ncbi:MAG TPA: sialate O-acetylesterase [Verrucomicrobiales bacterium]|nr:sialate O-acetylesterase [Verrucomicrobiales bacterium]
MPQNWIIRWRCPGEASSDPGSKRRRSPFVGAGIAGGAPVPSAIGMQPIAGRLPGEVSSFFPLTGRAGLGWTLPMIPLNAPGRRLAIACLPLLAALFLPTPRTRADVRPHGLFTDHMVLQRGISVPVWGWADEGEEITVTFRDQTRTTRATGGRWMVRLSNLKAGGPDPLTIKGKNQVVLQDVLVGEVWIASGQSNMEWPMRLTFEAEKEIAKTANPQLRLYTVPKLRAIAPTNDVHASWAASTPETSPGFSAVGWYFGRDLQKALGVPVGIIHTSWGGSPAEVWMSDAVLSGNARYKKEILDPYPAAEAQYKGAIAQLEKEKAEAKASGKEFKKNAPWAPWRPTELYNGMIAPLIPYAIKGAIWYQGESNAGRAEQYRSLFTDMIRNWRRDWGEGDFGFHLVQLAPFTAIKPAPGDSNWAELREAQWLSTRRLKNVGMAVITDVGEENDIHPRRKEPVGARLALAARKVTYGEKIVHAGPEYRSMKVEGDHITLRFDNVGGGLVARGGDLKGFAIAGEDRHFEWADARIEGKTIVVRSPKVPKPVAVRYGWADYPVVNLWNAEGLPATPFRTDDFPMVTASKP